MNWIKDIRSSQSNIVAGSTLFLTSPMTRMIHHYPLLWRRLNSPGNFWSLWILLQMIKNEPLLIILVKWITI